MRGTPNQLLYATRSTAVLLLRRRTAVYDLSIPWYPDTTDMYLVTQGHTHKPQPTNQMSKHSSQLSSPHTTCTCTGTTCTCTCTACLLCECMPFSLAILDRIFGFPMDLLTAFPLVESDWSECCNTFVLTAPHRQTYRYGSTT